MMMLFFELILCFCVLAIGQRLDKKKEMVKYKEILEKQEIPLFKDRYRHKTIPITYQLIKTLYKR